MCHGLLERENGDLVRRIREALREEVKFNLHELHFSKLVHFPPVMQFVIPTFQPHVTVWTSTEKLRERQQGDLPTWKGRLFKSESDHGKVAEVETKRGYVITSF